MIHLKLGKYLLATALLVCSTALGTMVVNHGGINSPIAVVTYADTSADQTINDVMPNKKLQSLVLVNMKEQNIVNNDFKLSDFTVDSFKADLAKLTKLVWDPSQDSNKDYIDLQPLAGGNGAFGPAGTNPGNYSLEGLQYATSLKDLSFLMNLNYGENKYIRNDVVNLQPLAKLTSLETINLPGNRISDVSPIAKLPNVKSLDISYNCIQNLNTLNADQYTENFNYFGQQVVFPVKYLSGNSYTWKDVFKNALPQNAHNANGQSSYEPYSPSYISIANSAAFGYPVEGDGPYQHVVVFRNGTKGVGVSSGTQTLNGDSITYTGLANQISPSADNADPWRTDATVIHTPYTYYMLAQYSIVSGDAGLQSNPVLRYYMPYETNQEQVAYKVIPYDKQTGHDIISYTPMEQQGMPGDKVDVPTINGYTIDDSQVVNGQVTVPESGGDIRVAYDKNVVESKYEIQPIDTSGNPISGYTPTVISGAAGDKVMVPTIKGYTVNDDKVDSSHQVTLPNGNSSQTTIIKVVYSKSFANEATLNINYLDNDNNQLLQQRVIHGSINNPYMVDTTYYPDTLTINGQFYTLVKSKMPTNLTGTLTANTTPVIFYYQKTVTPPNPNPGPGPEPIPIIPTPTPVNPTPVTPSNPTITTTEPAFPNKVSVKGEAVYSLKKVYLYKNANFKKNERRASYVKKPRVNRPMFVVTGYKNDANGRLRYKVRDVNHLSKTAGKTGYLTANYSYVRPVYYHSKHSTLTVINPKGVNEYTTKNLTGKVKNFKQGTQLKVKGFVKHNLTTRYLLINGHYITGNRKLVNMGKVKQPKRVVIKHKVYRHKNANFTKRKGSFAKDTKLNIKRYTFSYPTSTTKSGTKRFAVKGGYITANAKYVKVYYK